MSEGQNPPAGSADLSIGAAMSEIEDLHTALRATGHGPRRTRLLVELALAGQRLADLALALSGSGEAATRRSRWERRRVLAARGAAWIITYTRHSRPIPPGK
ncbi:hypothetical protein GCM10010319_22860 [Streptomyces blastmyceticus]|uniref:Uncharacterized protein n=1 Tax=Streptomyces blastmyceticus TaxID=68180 RepID=A0ABP3GIG5_9ACTN